MPEINIHENPEILSCTFHAPECVTSSIISLISVNFELIDFSSMCYCTFIHLQYTDEVKLLIFSLFPRLSTCCSPKESCGDSIKNTSSC